MLPSVCGSTLVSPALSLSLSISLPPPSNDDLHGSSTTVAHSSLLFATFLWNRDTEAMCDVNLNVKWNQFYGQILLIGSWYEFYIKSGLSMWLNNFRISFTQTYKSLSKKQWSFSYMTAASSFSPFLSSRLRPAPHFTANTPLSLHTSVLNWFQIPFHNHYHSFSLLLKCGRVYFLRIMNCPTYWKARQVLICYHGT